jgi:hypothetical protein
MSNTLSQNQEEPLRTNEEFAKNYKRANQDGIYGPIAIGNINEYQGRMIINLCMKTVRSGERNATYSQPVDWKLKFATGEFVNVLVQNGYIAKLMPISPKSLTSGVAKAIEEASAGQEVATTDPKTVVAAQDA